MIEIAQSLEIAQQSQLAQGASQLPFL